MVHDFVVTRDHVIFPIMPLTGSLERAFKGGPVYAWEPEKAPHIGVMPRNGSVNDPQWFRGEASYVFHPMKNARSTADGKIVMSVSIQKRRCFRVLSTPGIQTKHWPDWFGGPLIFGLKPIAIR